MKHIKIMLLLSFTFLLTACYEISNEIQDMKSIHQAFVNDLEEPFIEDASVFSRSYLIEDNKLTYQLSINNFNICLSFLKFNLNPNNIYWDTIEIFEDEKTNKITLLNEKIKFYDPNKYCIDNELNFILTLDKNTADLTHIQNIYLQEAEARILTDKEVAEVEYIMELYNMFTLNRDVIIREESIGGREIYVEHRNERNQTKADRIRLNIEYNNVSKKFCSDVIDVLVSNITSGRYNETVINNVDWESLILNGEKLTINYRYNNEIICHTNNSFKFVIYNEFDE